MDLVKIGTFIAQLRKEQGLTQEQLGEELGVTNKTVSRWETGTYLPPVEMLLEMSKLFRVSVNDLLSGCRLDGEAYREKAEENLIGVLRQSNFSLKEKMDYFSRKWLREHIAPMVLWAIAIAVLLCFGIAKRDSGLFAGGVIIFLAAHCWRNNSMMTYVEVHAFDGSGQQ